MNIQVCRDTSDAVVLYMPQRLYLKSYARLNISVQLPANKVNGKSISNWELMENLRKMIQPDAFSILKVSKHGSEVIRFDAELEQREKLGRVMARLEDRVVRLTNYPDPLKVKVSLSKCDFPSCHSWDSFFRDATDMDEMKPGERPDTIHIANLPIRWFVHDRDQDEDALPSESVLKKVFEKYGSIRQVDVPIADPFRMQMKAAMRGITMSPSEQSLYFEAYIQFNEYVGFVRCMDGLRGKKLLRKKEDIAEWCGISVDFDKTKHMTDAAVKRRAIVRERLSSRQRAKDDEEKAEKDKISKREARERQKYERNAREKLEKMREREERRKKKQLAMIMQRDNVDFNGKVAEERKKLLEAQKKLQGMRLIEELFMRIELRPDLQMNGHDMPGDRAARSRLVQRVKRRCEDALQDARERFQQALDGRIILRSALENKKGRRESSLSSASSDDRRRERDRDRSRKPLKVEKLTTPEREQDYSKTAGMYGMPAPYGFGFPYAAVPPPGYPFPQTSMYYGVRGQFYPPPDGFARRARGRPRGRARGVRLPYFDGPDASHKYLKYFKNLTELDDRARSRSRSRSRRRSYTRSRSRSRSRSRRRSYTRSRSRSRRSRTRSRSRSRRRTRSRSRRSRSHQRSRSRSRSRSRRSKTRSRSRQPEARAEPATSTTPAQPRRSKSWSLPKEGQKEWSQSPKLQEK